MKANIFKSVQVIKPKRNKFDLSHDVKMSCKMGDLVPICCVPTVPGDKFYIGAESLIRFAPMIAPVMHRINSTIHYFFVPNRILWENFPKFLAREKNPVTGLDYVAPSIVWGESLGSDLLKLGDYLGVPPSGPIRQVNALPFAAYQAIYNEYYRDQNLVDPVDYKLVDGANNPPDAHFHFLRRRAWEHDYFTAALPFAQKGEEVALPISDFNDVRVRRDGFGGGWNADLPPIAGQPVLVDGGQSDITQQGELFIDGDDLSAEAATVNNLRRVFRLQEWLEKNARGGTRFIEMIKSHFGITSSDARLQRPEYITGVKSPVMISEVVNTTGQVDGLPQGNMSGHAVAVNDGGTGSYFCEEHGYIIGIMNVQPRTAYQQALNKDWFKFDPLDYYWPSFANIGEQEVKNVEVNINHNDPDGTFGYVPRYAEYKFCQNRVAGDFRSSLAFWHLGRILPDNVALNKDFIECNPRQDIFAVQDGTDQLWCQVYNKITAIRPMPVFGTPMI